MFNEKLKIARKAKNLKQSELGELLGVGGNTISNWEQCVSRPDVDTVEMLCKILDISPNFFFDVPQRQKERFTTEEHTHITKYRELDERGKGTVDNVMNYEYEQTKNRKTTTIERETAETERTPTRQIPKTYLPASAGTGVYLHSSDYELIDIPDTPETKQVNFAVRVSGDSMEPLYYDGDTVLVKQQPSVEIGEIGVFVMDGEGYVKKLGNGEFISLNKNYAPMPFKGDVYTSGKVIGKL